MVKATLVGLDIEDATKVIAELDKAKLSPKVALWMTTPEDEDGSLVIASPSLNQTHPLRAAEQVAYTLHGKFEHGQPDIRVLRMNDPFVKKLRQMFGKTKSVEGMRLGRQTIGDRYVSDAYVYRIH
jgi:hypothetical protein